MQEPIAAAEFDPVAFEAARLHFRDELLAISPEVLRLLDKTNSDEGLADLNRWERAVLGMCVGFVTCSLLLPDPASQGVSIEPSRN